jgi:hypothetical protein
LAVGVKHGLGESHDAITRPFWTLRWLCYSSPTSHVPAPRRVDQSKIITETLKLQPAGLVVTRWSSRLLASQVRVDHATVSAI